MKWNIFRSLRYHEKNFHDLRCLTVMTSSSISVSRLHIVVSIHSCFQWYKNYKNRPKNAKVVVENNVASFLSGHCVVHIAPWPLTFWPSIKVTSLLGNVASNFSKIHNYVVMSYGIFLSQRGILCVTWTFISPHCGVTIQKFYLQKDEWRS